MPAIRNTIRKTSPTCRRGATVVEAAVLLPFVILFLLGILEYGRYVMTLQVLTNAAREGAHYAIAHTEPVTLDGQTYGNSTSDVTNIVDQYAAGQQLTGQTIEVYASDSSGNSNLGPWTDAGAGESICVEITGNYSFVVPQMLYLPSQIPVTAKSVMRSEGN